MVMGYATLADLLVSWRYAYGKRLAICVISGARQEEAEAIAAQQIGAEAIGRFRLHVLPIFENAAAGTLYEAANDALNLHPVSRSQIQNRNAA